MNVKVLLLYNYLNNSNEVAYAIFFKNANSTFHINDEINYSNIGISTVYYEYKLDEEHPIYKLGFFC